MLGFLLIILIQGFHELEHIIQVMQRFVFHDATGAGILGTWLDMEPVHLGYNSALLLLLILTYWYGGFLRRDARPRPLVFWLLTLALLFQTYHIVEHVFKIVQFVETGKNGTPGILGHFFNIVWLHFAFNTLVYIPVVLAFVLGGFHRRLQTPRLWPAVAAVAVLLLATGAIAASCTSQADKQRLTSLEKAEVGLKELVARLSYNTASGGGVNLKMMPDPKTGQPTVPLEEVFTFDRNHAMCRVDTNPKAFKMTTYQMGEVVIEPHQFFMAMEATTIEQYEVSTLPDGKRKVTMRGGLTCNTEVGQATVTIGSRNASEHATYTIEAMDGGPGGGQAGDTFAFTVFFDPNEAPVNHSIFGPKFTFTGQMVSGEITIINPAR